MLRCEDFKTSYLHLLAIFVGFAGFMASLVWEALGFPPCIFCVIERWMFLGIGIIGMMGFLTLFRIPALAVNGFWSLTLSVILMRHLGAQYRWWGVPKACRATVPRGTPEEMLAFLEKAPPVSCDQIEITFLGLAPTVHLFLCTAGLTLIFFWGFVRSEAHVR